MLSPYLMFCQHSMTYEWIIFTALYYSIFLYALIIVILYDCEGAVYTVNITLYDKVWLCKVLTTITAISIQIKRCWNNILPDGTIIYIISACIIYIFTNNIYQFMITYNHHDLNYPLPATRTATYRLFEQFSRRTSFIAIVLAWNEILPGMHPLNLVTFNRTPWTPSAVV